MHDVEVITGRLCAKLEVLKRTTPFQGVFVPPPS